MQGRITMSKGLGARDQGQGHHALLCPCRTVYPCSHCLARDYLYSPFFAETTIYTKSFVKHGMCRASSPSQASPSPPQHRPRRQSLSPHSALTFGCHVAQRAGET